MPTYKKGDVVPFRDDDPTVCPYCGSRPSGIYPSIYSDDHIFNAALGGEATTRVCKQCNDVFGHAVEGPTITKILHPMLLKLVKAGVPLKDPGAVWRGAATQEEGQIYDGYISENGYELRSTRPIVKRDLENPRNYRISVGVDAVGDKHLKEFKRRGFRTLTTARREVTAVDTELSFGFGKEMILTGLKMAFATATIAFPAEVTNFNVARMDMPHLEDTSIPRSAHPDPRSHGELDRLVGPLWHTIYLEQDNAHIFGLVQFFGALQVWVMLSNSGNTPTHRGYLATLDPLTWEERFRPIEPLHLKPWRGEITIDVLARFRKLNADAVRCGANKPETFTVKDVSIDGKPVGIERSIFKNSWTWDVPKKS